MSVSYLHQSRLARQLLRKSAKYVRSLSPRDQEVLYLWTRSPSLFDPKHEADELEADGFVLVEPKKKKTIADDLDRIFAGAPTMSSVSGRVGRMPKRSLLQVYRHLGCVTCVDASTGNFVSTTMSSRVAASFVKEVASKECDCEAAMQDGGFCKTTLLHLTVGANVPVLVLHSISTFFECEVLLPRRGILSETASSDPFTKSWPATSKMRLHFSTSDDYFVDLGGGGKEDQHTAIPAPDSCFVEDLRQYVGEDMFHPKLLAHAVYLWMHHNYGWEKMSNKQISIPSWRLHCKFAFDLLVRKELNSCDLSFKLAHTLSAMLSLITQPHHVFQWPRNGFGSTGVTGLADCSSRFTNESVVRLKKIKRQFAKVQYASVKQQMHFIADMFNQY